MKEIWKRVVKTGKETRYEVSTLGRVRSIDWEYDRIDRWGNTGKFFVAGAQKSVRINTKGYPCVDLSYGGVKETCMVHRLVAIAFLPNPEGKREVNHKNGIKSDNSIDNLEWVTGAENVRHSISTGLTRKPGKGHQNTKGRVDAFDTNGEFLFSMYGAKDIKSRGLNPTNIYDCINGSRGTKTHKGLTFKRIIE